MGHLAFFFLQIDFIPSFTNRFPLSLDDTLLFLAINEAHSVRDTVVSSGQTTICSSEDCVFFYLRNEQGVSSSWFIGCNLSVVAREHSEEARTTLGVSFLNCPFPVINFLLSSANHCCLSVRSTRCTTLYFFFILFVSCLGPDLQCSLLIVSVSFFV